MSVGNVLSKNPLKRAYVYIGRVMNRKIWENQKEFNRQFFSDLSLDINSLTIEEKVHWAKEFYFHINKELTDLVNCLPHWKMHYKYDVHANDYIKSNLKEEYIDCLKYFMGLGQVLGISYDDITDIYRAKTEVVEQKYKQAKIFEQLRDTEIIIFDIDGVINNYPDCYLDWVAEKTGIRYDGMDDIKSKLTISEYETIKEEYRVSGGNRNQPFNSQTIDTMQKLVEMGETIVLYTARPVSRYKRIYSDTLHWLKKNKVPFEAIFWSDLKKEDIYKLGLKIKFIVEDDMENAKFFNHEGYKVFLMDWDHNQSYNHDLTTRIENATQIFNYYKGEKNESMGNR